MRQWRVGSFSMGLLLVLLGVGLLCDHFSGASKAFELVITWWPLALILLGLEILAAGFLSRNENFNLKYDGWSIFLMIVFFFFSLGNYTLSCSGVIPQVQEALSITEHSCTIPDQEIELAGISKVIISSREGNLDLHSISGNKLTVLGQAEIRASSIEAAEALALRAQAGIKIMGDTLCIQIKRAPGQGNIFGSGYSRSGRILFVPAGIPLEVSSMGFGSSITLRLDSLGAPWSIDCDSEVRAFLSSGLDATITGLVARSRENLTGSAEWNYPPAPDSGEEQHRFSGIIKLGQGRQPLVISSGGRIEVNILPAH